MGTLRIKRSTKEIIFTDHTRNELSVWEGKHNGIIRIMIPAMGVRASYYDNFAQLLTSAKGGVTVISDLRGLGKSSIRASRSSDFGYMHYIRDLEELISYVKSMYGIDKVVTMGHSLGGQIACLHASRYPDHIQHITIIATCLPYYKSWNLKDKYRLMIAGNLFFPLSKMVGYFPGHLTGFAGREFKTVMKDWAHGVKYGKYKLTNSSFDYEHAMKLYDGGITSVSFDKDDLSTDDAVDTLLNKFTNSKKIDKIKLEGYDHFNWAKYPEATIYHCI